MAELLVPNSPEKHKIDLVTLAFQRRGEGNETDESPKLHTWIMSRDLKGRVLMCGQNKRGQ